MNNQSTNYTDYLKRLTLKSSNTGQTLKKLASIVLSIGVLTGIILGIVMFSKAGESKDSFLVGDTASGLFTWLGFGFLLGLPAISIIHYFLLKGLGEAIDLIQQHSVTLDSHHIESADQEAKAPVLTNKYGMLYCANCNNSVYPGEHECSKCHSILVFDNNNHVKKDRPKTKEISNDPVNESSHYSNSQHNNTPTYTGHLHSLYQNKESHSFDNKGNKAIPSKERDDISELTERIDKYYQSEPKKVNSRFCRFCGSPLKTDSVFCPECGSKVE